MRSVNINDLNADADEMSGGVEDVLNISILTESSSWGENTAGRSSSREKRLSAPPSAGGGTQQTKSKGLSWPLQIPRKSPVPPSDSDEGDGSNGCLFGNMMSMMMMQNRMDTKQREQQYKVEAKQREWEFQL